MRRPNRALTPDQCKGLLRAAGLWSHGEGTRNQALVIILWRTGLRCAECLELQLEDVREHESGGMVLSVMHPKGLARGAPQREVGLDSKAASWVRAWTAKRGGAAGPLFQTRSGAKLDTSYVRRLLRRLGKSMGSERRYNAHSLRATFARDMYDDKVGIVEIQLALGHSNLGTTQLYLRSVGAHEVIQSTVRRSW